MGIKDLLVHLKSIQRVKNVRSYAGKKVAIDGYCWLHQGAYHCAQDLVYGRGIDKLTSYCKKRLQMLTDANVTPILIFDGAKLQMKMDTESEREKTRAENKRKAEEYLRHGNSVMAHKMFSAAVDITPEMAYQFVQVAKQMGIESIISPYEADAQLAYMWKTGKVDVVITEDSDLLAFGVKKCLFKMDKNGQGFEIDLDELKLVEDINFRTFTLDMLLITCILSGCDYLDSIKGIGFKKAHKLVYETGNDIKALFRRIRREGKHFIPPNYEKTFEKALLTFKFQRIFCPDRQSMEPLNDPETHELGPILKTYDNWDFLGAAFDQETARRIAHCELDPISLKSLKESIEEKELQTKQNISQRVFYRKNNGVNQVNKTGPASNQHGLKKFFGVPKPQVEFKVGFTDEACSQQSDENKATVEEETKQATTKPQTYRPQFKLKSQNSQKSFSSQHSLSQRSQSQGEDCQKKSQGVAFEKQEQRVQDFVSSKKRTYDMITRDDELPLNQMKELSPVEHINKYFKKLKRATDDMINDSEKQSESTLGQNSKHQGRPQVLRQESWTIKRQEQKDLESMAGSVLGSSAANSTIAESSDPLAELDKKYPGFKKTKGYLKLEQQAKPLIAKTSHLSSTFSANFNSLKQQIQDSKEQSEGHKLVKRQVANILSKRINLGATSQGSATSLKDNESAEIDTAQEIQNAVTSTKEVNNCEEDVDVLQRRIESKSFERKDQSHLTSALDKFRCVKPTQTVKQR